MRYEFPVNLTREDDGRVSVTFDNIPGSTWGKDETEALQMASDALVTALSMYVDDGEPIPAPKAARGRPVVVLATLDAAKLALHNAMIAAKMTNVELARRLNLDEKAIRRLRDPLHKSHIGQVEAALKCLGQRLSIEVHKAA
jgi:antitoxin HicB